MREGLEAVGFTRPACATAGSTDAAVATEEERAVVGAARRDAERSLDASRPSRLRRCASRSLDPSTERLRGLSIEAGGASLDLSNRAAQAAPTPARGRWLTAAEATAYLGFPSRRALYMAIRRGQVPTHRLGRRMRFSVQELDAHLMGQPAVVLER